MSKNERLLIFIGRIQARIEDLGEKASETNHQVFNCFNHVADLEQYFNKALNEILSSDD